MDLQGNRQDAFTDQNSLHFSRKLGHFRYLGRSELLLMLIDWPILAFLLITPNI